MKISVKVLESYNKSCWQYRSTCKKFKQFQQGKNVIHAKVPFLETSCHKKSCRIMCSIPPPQKKLRRGGGSNKTEGSNTNMST